MPTRDVKQIEYCNGANGRKTSLIDRRGRESKKREVETQSRREEAEVATRICEHQVVCLGAQSSDAVVCETRLETIGINRHDQVDRRGGYG